MMSLYFRTHYSLRNGCHDLESYLQHWVLEANPRHHTDDGWITLSEHVNDNWVEAAHYWDTHQGLPFFEHSWELRPSSDHPPFVRFRVRMTGRNAANEFDICCSGYVLLTVWTPACVHSNMEEEEEEEEVRKVLGARSPLLF